MIHEVAKEMREQMDTNGDGNIDLGDNVDAEHYALISEACDENNDGSVDACELHSCIVAIEN